MRVLEGHWCGWVGNGMTVVGYWRGKGGMDWLVKHDYAAATN